MDKETYKLIQNKNKELLDLETEIKKINIVKEKEFLFHDKKSLEAFIVINNYLETKKSEYNNLASTIRNDKKNFMNTCDHEIGIKDSLNYDYYCLICQRPLICDLYKNCKFLIDVTKEDKVLDIILDTFNNVIYSDKDLVSTIEKELQNIQYEYEIKIIRR